MNSLYTQFDNKENTSLVLIFTRTLRILENNIGDNARRKENSEYWHTSNAHDTDCVRHDLNALVEYATRCYRETGYIGVISCFDISVMQLAG